MCVINRTGNNNRCNKNPTTGAHTLLGDRKPISISSGQGTKEGGVSPSRDSLAVGRHEEEEDFRSKGTG